SWRCLKPCLVRPSGSFGEETSEPSRGQSQVGCGHTNGCTWLGSGERPGIGREDVFPKELEVAKPRQGDWVVSAADQVLAEVKRRGHEGGPLVCASGISPSGPIHLGNLREIMVPHFVADELRRQGHECRHILSWDDYDRLRKVPSGIPDSFGEYIGRPL